MTSSTIREIPGITNPITHAGRVVYNARRDFLETRRRRAQRGGRRLYPEDDFGDSENHSIQQYELCFRSKKNRYKQYKPNDTDFSVYSSANGIMIPTDCTAASGTEEAFTAVRNELEFAGVASNRAIYDPNNNANEEGLAVQIGGLQTIYNNGNADIKAGDIVLWDMPAIDSVFGQPINRFPGVPHEKKLFSTVAYSSSTVIEELSARLEDVLKTLHTATDATAEGRKAIMSKAAETVSRHCIEVMQDTQRRVIGKALSTAKRGEPFDIVLGRYCA